MFGHSVLIAAWLMANSLPSPWSSGLVMAASDSRPSLSYTVMRLNGMLTGGLINRGFLHSFAVDGTGLVKIADNNTVIFMFNIRDVLYQDDLSRAINPSFYCTEGACITIYDTDSGISHHIARVEMWPSDTHDLDRVENACKRLSEIFNVVKRKDPFDTN